MKKVLLVLAVLICGCQAESTKVNEQGKIELKGRAYKYYVDTFEYEGCEYILVSNGEGISVTHKKNCKYCKQREENEFPPCKSHELTGPPK